MKTALALVLALTSLTLGAWAQEVKPDPDRAQRLAQQGAALMDQKKPEQAEPLFLQAAGLDPENPLMAYFLGTAEMSLSNYTSAAEAMQRALKLDAAHPGLIRKQRREVLDVLGLAYAFQKQFDKAKAVYADAVAKDPDYPGFLYNQACVFALAGDRKGALTSLKESLAADARWDAGPSLPDPAGDDDLKPLWGDPDFVAVLVASQKPQPNDGPGGGLAREGAKRLCAGDPTGAVEMITDGLETDANMAKGWFLLGGALEAKGKSSEAAEAYRKAIALNVGARAALTKPMVRYAALRLGQDQIAAQKFAEAIQTLKVAATADEASAAVHYALARAYAGTGSRAEAEAELKRVSELKVQLLPLDPALPDPRTDAAFAVWAHDKAWREFLGEL